MILCLYFVLVSLYAMEEEEPIPTQKNAIEFVLIPLYVLYVSVSLYAMEEEEPVPTQKNAIEFVLMTRRGNKQQVYAVNVVAVYRENFAPVLFLPSDLRANSKLGK